MGKYAEIERNTVKDWSFQKLDDRYVFKIGNDSVGQVSKHRNGWCAFAPTCGVNIGPVNGFKTRNSAAEYLLCIRRRSRPWTYDRKRDTLGSFQFGYAGCGYWRAKDVPIGETAEILHGGQVLAKFLDHVNSSKSI